MDGIWTVLGLEPTSDISAIKRAYGSKAKTCHPEEDPEGFLQLRQAYQAALAWAEKGESPSAAGPEEVRAEKPEPEDGGWSLNERTAPWDEGPNPFAEHPAARAFRELYTGKRRKDPKSWMDYFTSGDFLDVAWERRFTGLLLEEVTRLEGECPIPREFLTWLSARRDGSSSPPVWPIRSAGSPFPTRWAWDRHLRGTGRKSLCRRKPSCRLRSMPGTRKFCTPAPGSSRTKSWRCSSRRPMAGS